MAPPWKCLLRPSLTDTGPAERLKTTTTLFSSSRVATWATWATSVESRYGLVLPVVTQIYQIPNLILKKCSFWADISGCEYIYLSLKTMPI